MLTLVSGGSASGKSEFAESLVVSSGCTKRFYLATMIPFDEECHKRIARHRNMRAQKGFETIEVPTTLEKVHFDGDKENRVALLECMSNLVANELYSPDGAGEQTLQKVIDGVEQLTKQCADVIVVTNEIFSDGIQYDPSTQEYLRVLGLVNQQIAARADRVVEVVAGIPIVWKGKA